MFDTINGLPLHPLVVHAIVVLLPLAAIGTIVIALVPRLRPRYGWLVVAAAAVSTVLIPVATSSGESLEQRVGNPGEHAELGDQLIWFAIPLLIASAGLMLLDRRRQRTEHAGDVSRSMAASGSGSTLTQQSTAVLAVSTLAVVAALATSVQIYRVGDSGARAAWGSKAGASSAEQPGGDSD